MIRPKSRGAGLMISDEFNGYLQLSCEEYDRLDDDDKLSKRAAREMLQYGAEREGYWDNATFMSQLG